VDSFQSEREGPRQICSRHAIAGDSPYLELELRQDRLAAPDAIAAVAQQLSRVLTEAATKA